MEAVSTFVIFGLDRAVSERTTRMNIPLGVSQADGLACDVSRAQGESSGRKWGTGHRVRRKGEGKLGVLSAPLLLLAQEDP
eukprot:7219836-Pyramimonas_sp.AAC.2